MRRNRVSSRARQSADAQTLVKMAKRLSESGSRLEDRLWERRLAELVNDRLARASDDAIDAALDELARTSQRGYDDLADVAEACAETAQIDIDGRPHDVLLLAAPLLAWSRYKLPAATLSSAVTEALATHIGAHLAAAATHVAVADYLYSIDQLPEAFSEVHALTRALAAAAVKGRRLHIDPADVREPVAMLADTRYVLAAVATPAGAPLFHWQEAGVDPDAKLEAIAAFKEQAGGALAPVLTGCRYRLLSPNAFHASLRHGDRELREFSLEAAVSYLKLAYELAPAALTASLGLFEDPRNAAASEVRVGLGPSTDEDGVVEGVIWPLIGDDDDEALEEIDKGLRALGVNRIVVHAQRFPLEYCDDCGAPLFPNTSGHTVHAEPPEEAEDRPASALH